MIKLDVEGAEFELVEHLLTSKSTGPISVLAIEWHHKRRGVRMMDRRLLRNQMLALEKRLAAVGVQTLPWDELQRWCAECDCRQCVDERGNARTERGKHIGAAASTLRTRLAARVGRRVTRTRGSGSGR